MSNFIHPSIFLIPQESSYKEDFEKIQTFFSNEYEDLFAASNYSITVEEIINFKPTFTKIEDYRNKGIVVKHPLIISFIDLSKTDVDEYFNFLDVLKNSNSIRDNEYSDYRFINIIVRDLSRNSASNLEDAVFYERFENFCRENRSNQKISLSYFYNIIVDNFNEINGYKFDRNDFVFTQLTEQLSLIVKPCGTKRIDLNHCLLPTSNNEASSVRYNSIGLASVGFDQKKVAECVSYKRKIIFLQEIIEFQTLEDNISLEITREVQDVFDREFKEIETEIQENTLNISFQTEIQTDLEKYYKQQEDCNRHLLKSDISNITNSILQKIDTFVNPFTEKLKEEEEEAIHFSRIKEQALNSSVEIFTTSIFDQYNPYNSITAALYSLKSLLKPQKTHTVTQQENKISGTLKDKKKIITDKIVSIPKENTYEKKRNDIKETIANLDNRIVQKYNCIQELTDSNSVQWFTKNLINIVFFPSLGAVLSIMFFLSFDVKAITCLLIFSVFVFIGFLRAYHLQRELKEQKEILSNLTNNKNNAVISYANTYNNYFNSIVNKIQLTQCERILSGNITFIDLQIELIHRFKDSLINVLQDLENLYNAFDFDQDHFNRSIIGKQEIEYYCQKNKLSFFSTRKLSTYFKQFTDDTNLFSSFRYPDIVHTISKNEVIKPNTESFNENQHVYKEIEKYTVKTYLSNTSDKRDIVFADVKQGMLGDCYFLAALASIAHKKPHYIKKIIDDTKKNPAIYFYNEFLQTSKVSIDKKFWVFKEDEKPLYAHFGSKNEEYREIWVMLIEKGWAKINGMDYTKINGDTQSGHIREIDYSLALTGVKAIRENLQVSSNIKTVAKRIKEHVMNKPIVLYSVSHKNEKLNDRIITNHAYALLSCKEGVYEVYDPHGSIVIIKENELQANFDTILYFDFNYKEDKHLLGIYSDYFTRNAGNCLIKEFDAVIDIDVTEKILNQSLEETFSSGIFNLMIDADKQQLFTEKIIELSTPFVYLFGISDHRYETYFLGNNTLLQEKIKRALKKTGANTNNISILESDEKRIGMVKLRNNLNLKNVTQTSIS